ncbi:hypothetical protein ACFE04_018156 [Oxalis oulophora]
MEPSSSFPTGSGGGYGSGRPPPAPQKRHVQLQGPRPTPLSVKKESHKIKKPPQPPPQVDRRQPVIIYSVSPKTIHANVDDFMSVVQRLTGLSSADFSNSGNVSPAARLAITEKTTPGGVGGGNSRFDHLMEDPFQLMEDGGVEFSQLSGILSPAPASLPPVPAGYFPPASDPSTYSFMHDLSPFMHGSPSGLLSARIMSPMASPDFAQFFWDL